MTKDKKDIEQKLYTLRWQRGYDAAISGCTISESWKAYLEGYEVGRKEYKEKHNV